MWIVIIGLAGLIIISLIFVWAKQKRTAMMNDIVALAGTSANQPSLLTLEDNYKENYINRTSVDPNSVRGTIDLGLTESLLQKDNTNTSATQDNLLN